MWGLSIASCLLLVAAMTVTEARHGCTTCPRNACSQNEARIGFCNDASYVSESSKCSYRASTRTSQRIVYKCGFFQWDRCERRVEHYRGVTKYKTCYQRKLVCKRRCCSGFKLLSNGNCEPFCSRGCHNGGVCIDPEVCQCPSNWQGQSCTDDVNECDSNNGGCSDYCSNNAGSYRCHCRDFADLDQDGRHCTCKPGFSQNDTTLTCKATCLPACQNGQCTAPNYCTCNSGWSGRDCSQPTCWPACQNGRCTAPNKCTCNSGWTGRDCSQPVCSPSCVNGRCIAPNRCSCLAKWTGQDCSQPTCSPACQNGRCTSPNNCTCNSGWTGRDCSQPICSSCQNGGVCTGPNTCTCTAGWTGSTCDEDVDECSSNPCSHICHNTHGSFQCECRSGFLLNGQRCFDIDECVRQPCSQLCNNSEGSYTCSCRAGYRLKRHRECEDIDECTEGTQSCNQTCSNSLGSYQCSCAQGFILAENNRDCLKFDLRTVSSLPVRASDPSFTKLVQKAIKSCSHSGLCQCIRHLLSQLHESGYTAGPVQVGAQTIYAEFGSEQAYTSSDLLLALFQDRAKGVHLPIATDLKKVSFNCTSQLLYIETIPANSDLTAFPNVLLLNNVAVKVNISGLPTTPQVQNLSVTGNLVLGGKTFTAEVNYGESNLLHFTAEPVQEETIEVADFVLAATLVPLPTRPFGKLLYITDLSIEGVCNTSNLDYYLLFRGVLHITEHLNFDICIVVVSNIRNQRFQIPSEMAALTSCTTLPQPRVSLASLLQGLTGISIDGIPFLQRMMLPNFRLVFSTPDFVKQNGNKLAFIQSRFKLPALAQIFNKLEKGFQILTDVTAGGVQEAKQYLVQLLDGVVTFRPFQSGGGFSIREILQSISSTLELPQANLLRIGEILDIQIEELLLFLSNQTVEFSVKVPFSIRVFVDAIAISDLSIRIKVTLSSPPRIHEFHASGLVQLGGVMFDATIDYDRANYLIDICADRVGLDDIATAVSSTLPASHIITTLRLGSIALHSPCFSMQFEPSHPPEFLCLSADILQTDILSSGIAACMTQDRQWIYGLEIHDFVMSELLSRLVGNSVKRVSFLNQRLGIAVIISPANYDTIPLKGKLFDEVEEATRIVKGTTLVAKTSWPPTCSSDAFCALARSFIGPDAKFFLVVKLLGSRMVTVDAVMKDFRIGSLTLHSASLELRFSPSMFSIAIAASTELRTPPIVLKGALRLKLPQLSFSLEMSMKGCWNSAFGLPFLDICDFFIAVSITPGVPLAGLAFGARVRVGSPQCYVLEAAGYVSINPTSPADNFFYVEMGPLTVQRVLDLFCMQVSLPSFLGDTGFPEGFVTSYAHSPILIPEIDLDIPMGFYFKGTINILGLRVSCEMVLDPPRLIEIYARLYPLHLAGGLIRMCESSIVCTRGPYLHVILQSSPSPLVSVEASGYVSVLGIKTEAIMTVSSRGFEVSLRGNIFGALEAELRVYGSYGNLQGTEFGVEGKISNNILRNLEDGVQNLFRKAADAADKALSKVQELLESAKKVFDKAVNILRDAEGGVRHAREKVTNARRKLDDLRRQLDSICKFRRCRKVCIGFLEESGCKAKAWKRCICPKWRWNSCKFRLPDPICVLLNAGCFLLRLPLEGLILIAEGVLGLVEIALRAAEAVLKGAQVVVHNSKIILDLAIAAVEAVKVTVKAGLKALQYIISFTLTGIIDIQEIGFDARLALFDHGHISAYMKVSFLRQSPITLRISLPIFNPLKIVGELAENASSGITGRKRRSVGEKLNKVLWLAQFYKAEGRVYPYPEGREKHPFELI